jgi:hypothetical protein
MDINSASPDQAGPPPFHGMSKYPYSALEAYPPTSERQKYMERYNTRLVVTNVASIDCELPSAVEGVVKLAVNTSLPISVVARAWRSRELHSFDRSITLLESGGATSFLDHE